jgi:hypothetical protein
MPDQIYVTVGLRRISLERLWFSVPVHESPFVRRNWGTFGLSPVFPVRMFIDSRFGRSLHARNSRE